MPENNPTIERVQLLRSRADATFRSIFIDATPPTKILDIYFTANPKITEHGPSWASSRLPFVGKPFSGRRASSSSKTACDDYFDLLGTTFALHPIEGTMPAESNFIVDASVPSPDGGSSGAVCVIAYTKCSSVVTGKSWEETFIVRFSEFNSEGKIGYLELWSDSLSAWTAAGKD